MKRPKASTPGKSRKGVEGLRTIGCKRDGPNVYERGASSEDCPLGPHSMTRYWTLVKRDKKARVLVEEVELVRGSRYR